MKLSSFSIIVMLSCMELCFPAALYGGVFSNYIHSINNYHLVEIQRNAPSPTSIFRNNLGAANPVQWGRQLHGTANAEKFLSSAKWQQTRSDFVKHYGNSKQVQQYLDYQEYLFRKAIKINNKAHFRALDIKGNLAESLMDDFYKKDGWEKIDAKRGRNGFDGLYVKRNKNGTIVKWIAADAKSGKAKLSNTIRGKQLSPEWIEGNLDDLSRIAKEEYRKNPTEANRRRILDFEKIKRTPGRKPRVFRARIVEHSGKVQYCLENLGVDSKPVSKPMYVDMQAAKPGPMQSRIYKILEEQISQYDSKRASALVKKIKDGFAKGKIKSDSDIYRLIKREIPNKRLAHAITQELGDVPVRGSLAGRVGKFFARNKGTILSAIVVAGFVIAHDAMRNGVSEYTFLKAGISLSTTFLGAVAMDYGMKRMTYFLSDYLAKRMLKNAAKKVTEEATQRLAFKIAPIVGRTMGGTLQTLFAVAFIGKYIHDYDTSQITQTDMIVNVSIIALTTAGTVFFTCTELGAKTGAAIGSLFGPAGTAAGGAIGTGIGVALGVVGGIATGGYTWYAENEKKERYLTEARSIAAWETQNNKENLEITIRSLEEQASKDRDAAWQGLLPME